MFRVFVVAARWIYILGRRPGYDWTTGRRSGRVYRTAWQVGRFYFWGSVVGVLAILLYLVYFYRGGSLLPTPGN